MKKREASFQTCWNNYLRECRAQGRPFYGYFELKQTTGSAIYYRSLEEHQHTSLMSAEQEGLIYKWSDEDQREKPFDSCSTRPEPAYIIACYGKSRTMYVIPRWKFNTEDLTQKRRSVTEDHAKDLSVRVIHI